MWPNPDLDPDLDPEPAVLVTFTEKIHNEEPDFFIQCMLKCFDKCWCCSAYITDQPDQAEHLRLWCLQK